MSASLTNPASGRALPRGALPPVRIEGVAFWATRLPGWDLASAAMRGEQPVPDVDHPPPAPRMLAPNERRRTPDAVALALEVASRACKASGRSAAELPAVFASTHGDLAISDYMCSTLASTPSLISPIRFHNSVHNAAAGYWSIGTGSHAPYTAISAYDATFGAGLLEAVTQVACEGGSVLYVAFDVAARGPLSTVAPSEGLLGVGLVLAPIGPGAAGRDGTRVLDESFLNESGGDESAWHGSVGDKPMGDKPRRGKSGGDEPRGDKNDAFQACTGSVQAGRSWQLRVSARTGIGDVPVLTRAHSAAAAALAGNALAPCLPFFEALACDDTASLTLALGRRAALGVELESA